MVDIEDYARFVDDTTASLMSVRRQMRHEFTFHGFRFRIAAGPQFKAGTDLNRGRYLRDVIAGKHLHHVRLLCTSARIGPAFEKVHKKSLFQLIP